MRNLIVAIALAASLGAGGARANDCGDPGSAEAVLLPPSAVSREGLDISFAMGLEPRTFPLKDIRAERSPCRRAEFAVGDKSWTLFGGAESQPPRWATMGGRTDKIIFLAYMPWPEDAAAWNRSPERASGNVSFNRLAVALTIAEGDLRYVFVLYDKVPDDERLAKHMARVLEGEIRPFATYNVKTRELK